MADPPRALSPKEFAARYGVTTRTVRRWIKVGRIKAIKVTARTVRIIPMRTVADTPRTGSAFTS